MGLLLRGIDRIRVDFRPLDIGRFSAFPGDMAAVDAFHLVEFNREDQVNVRFGLAGGDIAVMETIYYVFYKKLEQGQAIDNNLMRQTFNTLLKKSNYLDAVRNSTGSPSKVMTRFELAKHFFGVQ